MSKTVLKRPVMIRLVHEPESHMGKGCTKPATWCARIAGGGPRKSSGLLSGAWCAEGCTREAAVRCLLERLREAGYSGTARVVG